MTKAEKLNDMDERVRRGSKRGDIFFASLLVGTLVSIYLGYDKLYDPVGAPQVIESGGWNLAIGIGAASKLTTGDYNFCWGDYACSALTTESCVVDIRSLSPDSVKKLNLAGSVFLDRSYKEKLIEEQGKHCGLEHVNAISYGLEKLASSSVAK